MAIEIIIGKLNAIIGLGFYFFGNDNIIKFGLNKSNLHLKKSLLLLGKGFIIFLNFPKYANSSTELNLKP